MARPRSGGLSGIVRWLSRAVIGAGLAALAAAPMVLRPEDVPAAFAPWAPLDPAAAPNFVTPFKLVRTGRDWAACRAALMRGGAQATSVGDRTASAQCHMRGAVRLDRLSHARLAPEATRCAIALRLLMWERHALQPAAREILGTAVARIDHFGSYSCRPIRSHRGPTGRMSEHATANAFDISGFVLSDGRRISLRRGWDGKSGEAAFLRRARDGLCDYFRVVLSPDYNALHADHLHVDQGLFLSCR
ncbi:MAG: extensin family protein [Paracoccaceae bacterium]|nr:extensin family protein [Paracoccaceae bacterium]